MQVQIKNASKSTIEVHLSSLVLPESEHKTFTNITPGGTQSYHVKAGTMRLTVRDETGNILWQGPVPTFIQSPLIFSDEGVSYQGHLIPLPVHIEHGWTWWIIAVALVILLCLFLFWYTKRKR